MLLSFCLSFIHECEWEGISRIVREIPKRKIKPSREEISLFCDNLALVLSMHHPCYLADSSLFQCSIYGLPFTLKQTRY
jgi:hypothetical protein